MNSIVDYSLRVNDLRVITTDYPIDNNILRIFLPQQLLNKNYTLSLIIYSIDNKQYIDNAFSFAQTTNEIQSDSDIEFAHNLNTINLDTIVRLKKDNIQLKCLYNNVLLNRKEIIYDLPDYSSMFYDTNDKINTNDINLTDIYLNSKQSKFTGYTADVIVYTNQYIQNIYLTPGKNTGNISWENEIITDKYGKEHTYLKCVISYDLDGIINGIINFNLREFSTNTLFYRFF